MIYVTKKCKNCGFTLQYNKRSTRKYGSPIRTCPSCRLPYLDTDYVELALEEKTILSIVLQALWALLGAAVFSFPLSGFIVSFLNSDSTLAFTIAYFIVFGFFIMVIVSGLRKPDDQKEIEASLLRLQNPAYHATLMRSGYKVGKNSYYERWLKQKKKLD